MDHCPQNLGILGLKENFQDDFSNFKQYLLILGQMGGMHFRKIGILSKRILHIHILKFYCHV